jgi:hypothetical protein
MSTLLDRYERQAWILPFRNAGAHEDLVAAVVDEARNWKQIEQAIAMGGDPTAMLGFAGLEFDPEIKDQPTVTGSATEQAMWPVARTQIPAAGAVGNPLSVRAPKMYRLFVSGRSTTAATPGTYTLSARVGNANTSPACGVAPSGNITPVASATAAQWKILGFLFIRQAGTAGTGVGSFEFNHSGTTSGGGPVSATGNAVIGGVLAATDFTLTTNGLWMGVTHATSTTNTWIPEFVGWGSWS